MERRRLNIPMIPASLFKTLNLIKNSCVGRKPGANITASLLVCIVGLSSISAKADDELDINQEDGLFTVSIERAALSRVVDRLSEITDIPMAIAENQDIDVSLSVSDYSLESLIEELSSSSMIIRRNIDGEDIISEVVFMVGSDGSDVPAAALPSGEPNAGIIAGGITQEAAVQTGTQPATKVVNESVLPSQNTLQGTTQPATKQIVMYLGVMAKAGAA